MLLGKFLGTSKPFSLHLNTLRNNTQLYVPLRNNDFLMSQNSLLLNDTKSEVLVFGPPNLTALTHRNLGVLASARNLGVIFDSKLCFD